MSEFSPYPSHEVVADISAELPMNHEPRLFIEAIEQQYGLAVRQIVDVMRNELVYADRSYPEMQCHAFWNELVEYDANGAVSLSGRSITVPFGDNEFLQAGYSNRRLSAELSYAEATDIHRYATQWEVSHVRPDERFKRLIPMKRVALRYDSYMHEGHIPSFAPWVGIQSPNIEGEFATVNLNGDTTTDALEERSEEYNKAIVDIMQTLRTTTENYL